MDRRLHNRHCGKGIRGDILNSNDLDILDISIAGAAIETGRRLELNREYTLRVHCKDNSFQIRVIIVWAMLISKEKLDKTVVPVYRAGVKFINISHEKETLIRNCIDSMEIKKGVTRL